MLKLSTDDKRGLSLLITPSWISGLVAVVAGLIISVGVIAAFNIHNSGVQQQLVAWEQTRPDQPVNVPGDVLSPNANKLTPLNSWPLLLVWSGVGLLVYGLAATIVHSLAKAEMLRESMDYVNAKPESMLASSVQHLLLRVIAAALLIGALLAFWKQIIPYGITVSQASASDVVSLTGAEYALLSFAIIALSVHVQVILLRLALGRARVFGE